MILRGQKAPDFVIKDENAGERKGKIMEQVLIDFISDLFHSSAIPVRKITLPCTDWSWVDQGLRTETLGVRPEDYAQQLNQYIRNCNEATVYHYTDMFQCNYTCANLPEDGEYLILGPFLYEKICGSRFDDLFQTLKLPEKVRIPLQNYYFGVTFLPHQTIYENLVVLIADRIYGKNQYSIKYENADSVDDWYHFYNNYLRIPDKPFNNIRFIEERYDQENAIIRAIRAGNEADALEQSGKLISMLPQRMTNALRDMKDYSITLNTLLRKGTEQAGVHPIHIDSLSNGHVKQIEQLTNVEQCRLFQRKMIRGYCRLVKEYNLQDYALPIRKAITYISTDLTADLSLKSLAEQLNVNASYLSSLFKKEMGIPLTEYVNTCRITHAQILLLSTDLPTKSIALRCGISDMYYFSRMFKRITGVTPKVYRDKASKEDWKILGNSSAQ